MTPQEHLHTLIEQLKNDDKISKHAILKSKKWTKSGFELLSDLIGDYLRQVLDETERVKMGTTLSSKTLSNIILGKYSLSYPLDPRTINSLSKLARFLDYSGWDHWVETQEQAAKKKLAKGDQAEILKYRLREAVELEFRAYVQLPEIHKEKLESFLVPDSPGYMRIMDILYQQKQKSLTLSNQYNPSTYEIMQMEIKSIQGSEARIDTEEYWLLCWWDSGIQRYVRRIKNISRHSYLMLKIEDTWKIRNKVSILDINGEEFDLDKIPVDEPVTFLAPGISGTEPG